MSNLGSSKIFLIGDPGSCHCGDLSMARELIRVGKECGLDAVKFQLFPKDPEQMRNGNVHLPYKWLPELVGHGQDLGVDVFASVFDMDAYHAVLNHCDRIKFSYKSRMAKMIPSAIKEFGAGNVFASGDIMNQPCELTHRLYCVPEYPVKSTLDFEGIFKRFDGFSDHTLGIMQSVKAVECGAKIIEKHYRLDKKECDSVPDGKFALYPAMLEKLARAVN